MIESRSLGYIVPDWAAPPRVHAAFTLRAGGVSAPPFDTLNLGAHTGDAVESVAENRRRVREALRLSAEPAWLEQVHGAQVLDLDAPSEATGRGLGQADGAVTRRPGRICAIQVADCMPVLFASKDGSAVGAAHAGWRGLAAGILEATVRTLGIPAAQLLAWIGPAIGPEHFEVGEEVRSAFLVQDSDAGAAFSPNARGRWQCDLYALARMRLETLGVSWVYGGGWSTYGDPARFFSYRRTARCGRMAALIWLAD